MSDDRNKLKRTCELTRLRVKRLRDNQRTEIASNLRPSTSYEQFAADRHVTESDDTDGDEEFNRLCESEKNVSEEAGTDLEIQELVMNESISDELS